MNSIADLIVLGGNVAIEVAAQKGGQKVSVSFNAGRTDASQSHTDIESFGVLEPKSDGFRNYRSEGLDRQAEELLLDRSHLMTLTAPEMTVLIGGMRVLNTNADGSQNGVLTDKPETLSNDFFVNLLDMKTSWEDQNQDAEIFNGLDRISSAIKWTATRADLIFGSNSQLRALAETYASDDASEKFVNDFVSVWEKVMNLDRFDLD